MNKKPHKLIPQGSQSQIMTVNFHYSLIHEERINDGTN